MKILALDPATKFGFAHSCGVSGTWDLSVRRDESAGMRLIRLRGKLNELLRDVGVDLVVYEAARNCAPRMQGALVVQAELQSVVKVWCEDNRLQYRGFSPSEIKKHATGKGNANKEKMLSAGRAKWPAMAAADDNEMDARWLLDLAQRDLGAATVHPLRGRNPGGAASSGRTTTVGATAEVGARDVGLFVGAKGGPAR